MPDEPARDGSDDNPIQDAPGRVVWECSHRKRDKWDWLKYGAELVGIIFLVVYTIFTAMIFCVNRKAADAAQRQTKLLRQQLVGTLGAIVEMNQLDFVPSTWTSLPVELKNMGKVPAHNVRVDFGICKVTLPGQQTIGTCRHIETVVPTLAVFDGSWNENPNHFDLSQQELEMLQQTKMVVKLEGTLSYENGFGDQNPIENFCWDYVQWEVDTMTLDRGLLKEAAHGPVLCSEVAVMLRNRELSNKEQKEKKLPTQ
jgi:hypothetical protein